MEALITRLVEGKNNQFKSVKPYKLHRKINVPGLDCFDTLFHIH